MGVNREQIILYWNIGKVIIENTQYGKKFIENLARDIKLDFPNSRGYSVRNLKYMRKFAGLVDDFEIVQKVSALFTWSHNITLMNKTKDLAEYLWYADRIIDEGLSLSHLEDKISLKAYERQAIAEKATNYERLLLIPFSGLRQSMRLKMMASERSSICRKPL